MLKRMKKLMVAMGIMASLVTTQKGNAESAEHVHSSSVSEVAFQAYIPYVHQVSLNYMGNGETFYQATMLLEYKPDEAGIFQVTSYDQTNDTHTFVYQISVDGLYELAHFTDNPEVQDLRYSPQAQDEEKSLILPSKLVVGQRYQSGYHHEIERTVESIGTECWIDDSVYGDVVEVKEVLNVDGRTLVRYRYFAPYYGEILVTDGEGVPLEMLQLTREP